MVAKALSRRVQVNNITIMSSYGIDSKDRILQVDHQDDKYMEIMQMLQKSTGIGTGTGTGTGTSVQNVDYCLTAKGLVRFRDRIYVPDSSELKKVTLREFHVRPYLGHLGYQKAFIEVMRFYY